jgi:hypothetical protein
MNPRLTLAKRRILGMVTGGLGCIPVLVRKQSWD